MKKFGFFIVPLLSTLGVSCSSSNFNPQSGSGPAAVLNIPAVQNYNFGSQLLDSNTTSVFTLTNSGQATASSIQGGFTTSAFVFTGGQFPGTGATCGDSLAVGASCTISVTFNPQYYQSFQDSVRISYYDGTQTQTTQNPILSGQGIFGTSGSLDSTFAGTGAVALGSGSENGLGVVVQPDRNIVIAGSTGAGLQSNFLLARFQTDGVLNPAFGNQGVVNTDFYHQADEATAVALESDGNIVAVGNVQTATNIQFGIARYLPSGALDISFGNLGRVSFGIGTSNSGATAVAIDQSGNLVIAGYAFSGTTQVFALARVLANGTVDNGFGSSGLTITSVGSGNAYLTSVNIDGSGRILATGYASNGTANDMVSIRYTSSGAVDASYGSSGVSILDFGTGTDNRCYQSVLFPNGQMILAGSTTSNGITNPALVRINVDGTLDTTFGASGKVILSLGTNSDIRGLSSGPNGPIYAAGTLYGTTAESMVVSRLNWDGSLDNTFATNGTADIPLSSGSDIVYGLAEQANGKVLLVGTATITNGTYAGLARIWP